MSVVEIERADGVMVIRMNRPERLNAMGMELRAGLAQAWQEFHESRELEVAIFTGTGRGFCAGDDMKERLELAAAGRTPAPPPEDIYRLGKLDKPVIAAVNGFAMGGGFKLVERADFRVAARGVIFDTAEVRRHLLGAYDQGLKHNLPHAFATELAFGFHIKAERMYEMGFLNRVVDAEQLIPTAREMAAHLMTLPPASRVNTLVMMRAMRGVVPAEIQQYAARLNEHGAKSDLKESRKAFAEKRKPVFKGWDDPEDRYRTPKLERG